MFSISSYLLLFLQLLITANWTQIELPHFWLCVSCSCSNVAPEDLSIRKDHYFHNKSLTEGAAALVELLA